MRLVILVAVSLAVGVVAVAPVRAAALDEPERRASGACSGPGRSGWELRLRPDDGRIRVEFRVRGVRGTAPWRVVVLHERRIAYSLRATPDPVSRSLRVRRTVRDWPGTDLVSVRATGPRGEACAASALV